MQAKGILFVNTFNFLKNKFGTEKTNHFINSASKIKKLSSSNALEWIPVEEFIYLLAEVEKYFGFNDGRISEETGAYSANQAMETTHRLFKNMPPYGLINTAPAILSSYYTEAAVRIEHIRDNKVKMFFSGFPDDRFVSKRLLGWLKQGIVNTSAQNIRVTELDFTGGIAFLVEWD